MINKKIIYTLRLDKIKYKALIKIFLYLLLDIYISALYSKCYAQENITVAAAANVKFVIEDLKKEFKKETGININSVISSSGKLTSQIKSGAPFHIFMSADTAYPDLLYKEGFSTIKPKIYSYGSIVLWSSKNFRIDDITSFLLSDKVKKIAIANPKNAPYGKETINILNHYGIYQKLKDKIVYGDSISQVNNYISLSAVDVGFTSKSTVVRPDIKLKGTWKEIDKNAYKPIEQSVIILKYSKDNNYNESKKFYDFLFSKKGKEIFKSHGYIIK